jgi:hypothetical protein
MFEQRLLTHDSVPGRSLDSSWQVTTVSVVRHPGVFLQMFPEWLNGSDA